MKRASDGNGITPPFESSRTRPSKQSPGRALALHSTYDLPLHIGIYPEICGEQCVHKRDRRAVSRYINANSLDQAKSLLTIRASRPLGNPRQ